MRFEGREPAYRQAGRARPKECSVCSAQTPSRSEEESHIPDLCGRRTMASTLAFQAGDDGSIPFARFR